MVTHPRKTVNLLQYDSNSLQLAADIIKPNNDPTIHIYFTYFQLIEMFMFF